MRKKLFFDHVCVNLKSVGVLQLHRSPLSHCKTVRKGDIKALS